MNGDDNKKRPLMYYYVMALMIILLINTVIMPTFFSPKVHDVSYNAFMEMVDQGKAVIMVTSDMTELLGTCDRIIVFSNGQITKTFMNEEATEEKILYAAVSAY